MELMFFSPQIKEEHFEIGIEKVDLDVFDQAVYQKKEYIEKNDQIPTANQQQYKEATARIIPDDIRIESPTNIFDHPHLKKNGHKCTLYNLTSTDEDDFKMHAKSVHLNMKKHKCTMCVYASNQKKDVNRHVKYIHLNIKDHKCTMCDYTAYRKSHFNSQVVSVHWNLKNHHCTTCDYETNRNVILKYHIESIQFNVKKHCEYQKCTSSSCRFCSFGSEESQV